MIVADGDMIRLDKFVHLYRLMESKKFEYYELVPWDRRSRLIINLPSSFYYWKSRYFFVLGDGWETLSSDFWGEIPRLLRRWETPQIGAFISCKKVFCLLYFGCLSLTFSMFPLIFAVKKHPKLESKYKGRV